MIDNAEQIMKNMPLLMFDLGFISLIILHIFQVENYIFFDINILFH